MRALKLSFPLRRFLWVSGFLWLIVGVVSCVGKLALHLPPERWYPLFRWEDRFTDLTIFRSRFEHFHQADFFQMPGYPFEHPAPVALALYPFLKLGQFAVPAYLACCLLSFVGAGLMLSRAMVRRGMERAQSAFFVGMSLVLSYPVLFLMDRANIEMVNWLLIALGVCFYWNNKWFLSATFLGIAISFKLFPLVFLGLFLRARKFRALAWCLVTCAASTIICTWALGPTFYDALAGVASGLQWFKVNYVLEIHPREIGFDHSLFALVKLVSFPGFEAEHSVYLPILNRYMVIAAVAGILIFLLKVQKLPRANQILALTVASVLFCPVSGDYTLVHLYIPWAVLALISIRTPEGEKVPGLIFCFTCLAFLMAPESYLVFQGVRFAGQVKALVLCMLFCAAITYPFEEAHLAQASEAEVAA